MKTLSFWATVVIFISAFGLKGQSVYFVENSNDSGDGSLRQIIENSSDGDTIKFSSDVQLVNLESGELVITKTLSIVADSMVTIQRTSTNNFRIILVPDSSHISLYLRNITVYNGHGVFNSENMDGGGICLESENAKLILENCTIENNKAGSGYYTYWNGGRGGGIFAHFAKLINCMILDNMAGWGADDNTNPNNPNGKGGDGGGIYCDTLVLINSLVFNNYSGAGGGGYIHENDGGDGGGVFVKEQGIITNSTICYNTAEEGGMEPAPGGDGNPGRGGGIFLENDYGISMTNCIISENISKYDYLGNDLYGNFIANYNLISDTEDYSLDGDNNFIGIAAGFQNPPNDLTLSESSPAINAGTPDTTGLLLPQVDLLNNLRISGDTVDIGAYEFQLITGMRSFTNAEWIKFFPNPNGGTFWIKSEKPGKKFVELFNSSGEKIKEVVMLDNLIFVDISNYPDGVYFVRVTSGSEVFSQKTLIKKTLVLK